MKPIQRHVELFPETEAAIQTHIGSLIADHRATILTDIAQEIENGIKGAEAEVVLKFSIPLRATEKTLTLNAALEWEIKHKRKDETEDQQIGGDQKLPGMP